MVCRRLNWFVWGDDMQLFSVIMPKMVYFFILMALGFVLAKIGMIPKPVIPTLSALVVRVFLPCLQMGLVFENGTTFGTFLEQSHFALMQLCTYIILTVFGLLGAALFRLRYPQRNSFTGGMVGGNFGFLFVPLIVSSFPAYQGFIPIMAAMDTLYVWTVGLFLYSEGTSGSGGKGFLQTLRTRLLNPMLIAILISLCISSLHITLPRPLTDVISGVGNVSGTIGMMLLGANICFMQNNLKARAGSSLGFVFLRQLAAPLTVFLLSRLVVGESQALLLMLLAGIPTMTTTGLLAIEYHTDVDYASNLVFVSTILSLATLPLIALISGYL